MNIRKNIALIAWMWKLIYGIKAAILFSVILGLLRIVFSLAFIWVSKEMIDLAVSGKSANIYIYAVSLAVVLLLEISFSALYVYCESQAETKVRNNLRRKLFIRALNSVWRGKERFHTGDIVNRLEEDVRVVSATLCSVFPGIIITSFQFVAAFIFLWNINSGLAWVIVFIMPVFLFVSFFIARRMKRLTKEIRDTDSRVQSIMQESLQKRIIVLALMRVDYIFGKLLEVQDILIKQTTRRNSFSVVSRIIIMTGFSAGYLTAFIWGVVKLQEGIVTFGMLSAFLQLVGQIQRPTAELSRKLPQVIHSLASADRLYEICTSEQEVCMGYENTGVARQWRGIVFNNVTFGYCDSSKKIFSDFSYDFIPGSSTAIMGETGAGKSTMMRLMLGLLKPESGSIYLYSDDGNSMAASPEARLDVVYVPQGNSLLSGTIRDNLIAGNKYVTGSDIEKAIYMAAAEFIYELPEGLDTKCGEGGEGLSEGQAQRISIARALLSRGRIMLLDEFTSALDSETESKIMERLTKEVTDKTMIFITHRKKIADMCTNVLRINKTNC